MLLVDWHMSAACLPPYPLLSLLIFLYITRITNCHFMPVRPSECVPSLPLRFQSNRILKLEDPSSCHPLPPPRMLLLKCLSACNPRSSEVRSCEKSVFTTHHVSQMPSHVASTISNYNQSQRFVIFTVRGISTSPGCRAMACISQRIQSRMC